MNDCILYAKIGNESEVGFMDITGLDAALSTVSAYDILQFPSGKTDHNGRRWNDRHR
jgi:hypothetical protein